MAFASSSDDNNHELEAAFQSRIDAAIATVQAWEDVELFRKIRASLPWEALAMDHAEGGLYSAPSDICLLPSNLRFLQRLARYFKKDVMTWVNQPSCQSCAGSTDEMQYRQTRGPQTDDERSGRASRVEVYECQNCHHTTSFPRYNNPHAIFDSRQGRCGEYANLFGAYCRAVGLETRYISDFTDHVWTECYIGQKWVMVDSCEGVIDEPSMYEAGWGKKLNYILAVSTTEVIDATPRYTRQWYNDEFQARRRSVITTETLAQEHVRWADQRLRHHIPTKLQPELMQRRAREEAEFGQCRNATHWNANALYAKGRISGSYAWKESRNETGRQQSNGTRTAEADLTTAPSTTLPTQFAVESYCPVDVSIRVVPQPTSCHGGIVVGKVECAMGSWGNNDQDRCSALSVVVVDDGVAHLGCLLQSRLVHSLPALMEFLQRIPTGRVIALNGTLSTDEKAESTSNSSNATTAAQQTLQDLLPGLNTELFHQGILFIGQVRVRAEWAICQSFSGASLGIELKPQDPSFSVDRSALQLKTYRHTRPAAIIGRLDERTMPLATQLLATHEQKRLAFLSWSESKKYSGYVTKAGAPIYLLGPESYPLEHVPEEEWGTFLWLPSPLVSKHDCGIVEASATAGKRSTPSFDVPLEASFFNTHLGSQLLVTEASGAKVTVDTVAALSNARLIGLYFSAHWCGPCRSFTPMLAEMYQQLKDSFPTHGLEVVFVSSDRDVASFTSYFSSMPWQAIPLSSPSFNGYKQLLSNEYGIRGIPSFVVLDAMSGQVVVSANASRNEILHACNRGDEGIESLFHSWMDRLPTETKELASLLELSCVDDSHKASESPESEPTYLYQSLSSPDVVSKEEMAVRVKSKFTELVRQHGMSPNVAAATAIRIASGHASNILVELTSRLIAPSASTADSTIDVTKARLEQLVSRPTGADVTRAALSTLLKYVENARKEPWNPRFRLFKLSNKVADRMVSGLELLHCLGLEIAGTESDFCGSLPVGVNLDSVAHHVQELLDQIKVTES